VWKRNLIIVWPASKMTDFGYKIGLHLSGYGIRDGFSHGRRKQQERGRSEEITSCTACPSSLSPSWEMITRSWGSERRGDSQGVFNRQTCWCAHNSIYGRLTDIRKGFPMVHGAHKKFTQMKRKSAIKMRFTCCQTIKGRYTNNQTINRNKHNWSLSCSDKH
jgi:hypothetical protein